MDLITIVSGMRLPVWLEAFQQEQQGMYKKMERAKGFEPSTFTLAR